MRFTKSAVQVRECGIAFRYILLGHLGGANVARVSANADARALLFMFTQRVSENAGAASRFRPGIFSRAARFRIKACKCRRLSGARRHLSQKWEYGPRPHLCPSSATRASLSVTETMASPS